MKLIQKIKYAFAYSIFIAIAHWLINAGMGHVPPSKVLITAGLLAGLGGMLGIAKEVFDIDLLQPFYLLVRIITKNERSN